jgi:hypothetical protein
MRLIVVIQGVAAQLRVAGGLPRREKVGYREVISQMRGTQRALRGTDPGRCVIQQRLRYALFGEQTIERYLIRNDPFTDRNRLGLHLLKQCLGPRLLLRRELKGIGEFEHMSGACVTVEFSGEGEAHPSAGFEIRNLLLRKCFYRAPLHTRIGRGGCRRCTYRMARHCGAVLVLCRHRKAECEQNCEAKRALAWSLHFRPLFAINQACHGPAVLNMIEIMSSLLVGGLSKLAERKRALAAGDVLFRAGDPIRSLFLVASGALVLSRSLPHGSDLVLQRAGPGAVLAEASLFAESYHCDAIAAQPSVRGEADNRRPDRNAIVS